MASRQETVLKFISLLDKVPVDDRARFARTQLSALYPGLIAAFDAIPSHRLHRTILFLSVRAHYAREPKLAAAARLAGWDVHFVYWGRHPDNPEAVYCSHHQVDEVLTVLVGWAFPGKLIHLFADHGEQAWRLCQFKHRKVILDIFDTCSGQKLQSANHATLERTALATADAMVHRDLRAHYLRRFHGYTLPPHNLFLVDPIAEAEAVRPRVRDESAIRVVAVGWTGDEDTSIVQTSQALCAGGVHVHVYPFPAIANMQPYQRLQQLYPEHFHIENPVFGREYHEHLRRYDFGLTPCERYIFGETSRAYTDDYFAGCGSSRLMDYIQAGLGIIIPPDRKFQYACVRRFGTGAVIPTIELLRNPREVLAAALERKVSVPSSRLESITISAAASRLSSFYEKVQRSAITATQRVAC